MTTTQLFAELLVIGIGGVLWLGLAIASVFGYRFDKGLPQVDPLLIIALAGVAYLLGIVTDRLAYSVFGGIEKKNQAAVLGKSGLPTGRMIERHILVSSDQLASQILYNRSRLRVCRAWILNFALITLVFTVWNLRVRVLSASQWLPLVMLGIVLGFLTAWTALTLSRDHYKNIGESYEFLKSSSASRQLTQAAADPPEKRRAAEP
jgi:hypothetical protein